MTFFALKNHSKRTYRFRRGDFFPARATRSPWLCFALKSHIIESNLILMVQEKGKIFSGSRSALAMIMFCLITHSKKTWRFKTKDFFWGSRYALNMIILCLINTLSDNKKRIFFRLALRGRLDYFLLILHTLKRILFARVRSNFLLTFWSW